MVVNRQNINRLKALGLMACGLGIGSGGTLLLLQWTADTTAVPEQGVERQQPPKPALTTALLLQGNPFWGPAMPP